MIQRLELAHEDGLVRIRTSNDGDYVLYTDHLAEVRELVRLCLSNGIISRGLACECLGCAREDLDDMLKGDSDG